jgi:serine/threonine protein kinase
VKVISTPRIQELGYEASVSREIAVLRMLSHPGIARMVSSFRWRDGAYLVLEYAAKGDLHSYIVANGSLSEESARWAVFPKTPQLDLVVLHNSCLALAPQTTPCGGGPRDGV